MLVVTYITTAVNLVHRLELHRLFHISLSPPLPVAVKLLKLPWVVYYYFSKCSNQACSSVWCGHFCPEVDHLHLAAVYLIIRPSCLNPPPSPFIPNQQQLYLQKNFLWWQLEVSWLQQLLVKSKVHSKTTTSYTHPLYPRVSHILQSWLWLKFLALTIGDQCVAVYGTRLLVRHLWSYHHIERKKSL